MCQIKFRAWERTMKEIIPVGNIDFSRKMINTETAWRCFDEIELMQYTGLQDKNGKEIYEGDIIKLSDTNPVLFKVEVILGKFGYRTVFKHLADGTIAEGYFLDKCTVIGNIHENPELLEVSHETIR